MDSQNFIRFQILCHAWIIGSAYAVVQTCCQQSNRSLERIGDAAPLDYRRMATDPFVELAGMLADWVREPAGDWRGL
jgi:hypothetical protein